ncbi:acyl-CoA dehydrogenase family protein [Frankia sp. AgPm24]|uniref:acyl-CoA dehydrogenase family protein n=1 Tax=Frankia TaxID=1854 RepID=UPI0013CF5868|nr:MULTISPECIES: acyl-CoA dehydrogenase family protein [Frankia]MCK9925319.1 acyl-CoA dehydrogenase family protein [Frankia sp. AgPm24]
MQRTLFDADHELFRASVRAFVERTIEPGLPTYLTQRLIDRAAWREAGEAGFLGVGIPEELGGSGVGDYRFNAVWLEELAKASLGVATSFSLHTDIVAPYLVELTTPEQRERWLPGFCAGEIVTAIGMTEASGGSDLAALRTTAVRDGPDWIINGSKTFITNGSSAELVIIAARTNPDAKPARGITLFAVEEGMAGFTRGRKLDKVGQHEADTAELFFTDLRVGADAVLGEVDRGFVAMMERLPQERISCAVTNLAHADAILAETITYARERRAFGAPIGSFQHNKFLLAELVTQLDVAQAFIDACVAAHSEGALSAVDAAKAKWWSSQVQNEVLDSCVQLHGGYGYMTEYRAAQAWMDGRVTRIWAGSNEIMKEIIGRDLGF